MSVRYRRNFVIATIIHVAIIASVMLWENFHGAFARPAPAGVSLYTQADILGDMPKGKGDGRGAYKAPEPAGANEVAGPNADLLPPDESHASQTRTAPNEIKIPTKMKTKKPVTESKPVANTKSAGLKKPVVATKSKATAVASKGSSFEDIKNRLMKAADSVEGGTPYGDNKKPGGGSGNGRIGSPNGSPDGVANGVGPGTANWKYFDHVHDVMYQAWEQPGSALDRKLVATVQLRIARDGTITDASLRSPSGNKVMDESVLTAARKVQRLDPPPDNLLRADSAIITVDFQVEG